MSACAHRIENERRNLQDFEPFSCMLVCMLVHAIVGLCMYARMNEYIYEHNVYACINGTSKSVLHNCKYQSKQVRATG